MKRFVCKALLFDLDGVLADSHANVERHWRRWADQHGIEVARIFAIMHGRRTIETIQLVAPTLEDAAGEALRLEQEATVDKEGTVAIAGAYDLLTSLPPERWAVVTSGTLLLARPRLQYIGLPLPDVFITGDDVVQGKPHPEGYLKAAALLGFLPQDCIVVEDALAGIQAAHAAGMRVIALDTSYHVSLLQEADARTHSLANFSVSRIEDTSHDFSLEVLVEDVAP